MLLADAERVAGDGSVGIAGRPPLERRGTAAVRAYLARRRAGRKNEQIDGLPAEQSLDEVAPSLAGGRPPPPRGLSGIQVEMRHCITADHHRNVCRGVESPRMRKRGIAPARKQPDKVLVLQHARVTMIAADPEMHLRPTAVALGVGANARDGLVDDPHRVGNVLRFVSARVRSLVDPGQRDESEFESFRAQAARGFLSNVPVDAEPAAHVAAEVSSRRSHYEHRTLADPVAASESASNHAQCAETWFGKLEDRRRRAIDVLIDVPHLGSDVAAGVSRLSRGAARAIEPAETGQADAAW